MIEALLHDLINELVRIMHTKGSSSWKPGDYGRFSTLLNYVEHLVELPRKLFGDHIRSPGHDCLLTSSIEARLERIGGVSGHCNWMFMLVLIAVVFLLFAVDADERK